MWSGLFKGMKALRILSLQLMKVLIRVVAKIYYKEVHKQDILTKCFDAALLVYKCKKKSG